MKYQSTQILTEQIIVDIIKQQMNLADDRVFIANQNRKIGNDKGLYVIVGLVDSQVMANGKSIKPITDDSIATSFYLVNGDNFVLMNGDDFALTDNKTAELIQQMQVRENIQIDIVSNGNLALMNKHRILLALNSIYADQQQEKYNFKIFKLPTSFVNTSLAEGGSQINRFTIVIPCFVWYREDIRFGDKFDYYDDFSTRLDDEETIGQEQGLIEFNIN